MSDYLSLPPIPGAITSAVQDNAGDLFIVTFPQSRVVEGFEPSLIDASTSGSVVVEVRTAIAGGGSLVASATFLAGEVVPSTVTGVPFTVPVSSTLYLRVEEIGTAAGGFAAQLLLKSLLSFSGVADELTTVAIVNAYDPATVDMDADAVARTISGVSDRMVRWFDHVINLRQGIVEYPKISGTGSEIALDELPVSSVVVEEDGATLVENTAYRVDANIGILTRLANNGRVAWSNSKLKVTYDAGYAEVPPALVELATWQVVAELHRVDDRLVGVSQRDAEAGAGLTFEADGFLPSVIEGMKSWRRVRV